MTTGLYYRWPLTKLHPLKRMRHWGGRLRAMTHLGMISSQGPTGACDGRAHGDLDLYTIYRFFGPICLSLWPS